MKKLLSLLSVLTISGAAIPTTIAASPYQKEENINNLKNLIRNKRDAGSDCEGPSFFGSTVYCSLAPELWEEIVFLINDSSYKGEDLSRLPRIILSKLKFYVKGTCDFDLADTIVYSFDYLNNLWQNSDKKHHIRIVYNTSSCKTSVYCNDTKHLQSANIREDWGIQSNKYLSRLENDLKIFNLNLIDNEKDETILNAIKNKNPNLDISQIEIASKEKYSYFSKGFNLKIKVKNGSERYSNGIIKNSFIFNTKDNINKINEIIKNDSNVVTLINHLQDWNNDVKSELKLTVPQKTAAQKFEWKNRKKEDLKTYMREWSYILELIDHKLKLEELNDTVQGIKQEINNLKLQINEINEKITTNKSLENCANIGGLISASTGWIPYIGTLISTVAGTVAAICTIDNA